MEDYIESVETPEVAEPVDTEVSDVTNETVEENTEVVEETTETADEHIQSAEENARYAAARRRAEEQQRLLDEQVAREYGDFEHPITHKKISSAKEYFDALRAQKELQDRQRLASGEMSAEEVDSLLGRMINNNPVMQEARAIIDQNNQNNINNAIAEGIKEIQKLNPTVKSIEDIMGDEKGQQIVQYVQNGLSLADAYKMANFDVLLANSKNASKQATINNLKGTQHLNQTNGISNNGDTSVDIPEKELSIWRKAFPDASLSELKKKYNRTL